MPGPGCFVPWSVDLSEGALAVVAELQGPLVLVNILRLPIPAFQQDPGAPQDRPYTQAVPIPKTASWMMRHRMHSQWAQKESVLALHLGRTSAFLWAGTRASHSRWHQAWADPRHSRHSPASN